MRPVDIQQAPTAPFRLVDAAAQGKRLIIAWDEKRQEPDDVDATIRDEIIAAVDGDPEAFRHEVDSED